MSRNNEGDILVLPRTEEPIMSDNDTFVDCQSHIEDKTAKNNTLNTETADSHNTLNNTNDFSMLDVTMTTLPRQSLDGNGKIQSQLGCGVLPSVRSLDLSNNNQENEMEPMDIDMDVTFDKPQDILNDWQNTVVNNQKKPVNMDERASTLDLAEPLMVNKLNVNQEQNSEKSFGSEEMVKKIIQCDIKILENDRCEKGENRESISNSVKEIQSSNITSTELESKRDNIFENTIAMIKSKTMGDNKTPIPSLNTTSENIKSENILSFDEEVVTKDAIDECDVNVSPAISRKSNSFATERSLVKNGSFTIEEHKEGVELIDKASPSSLNIERKNNIDFEQAIGEHNKMLTLSLKERDVFFEGRKISPKELEIPPGDGLNVFTEKENSTYNHGAWNALNKVRNEIGQGDCIRDENSNVSKKEYSSSVFAAENSTIMKGQDATIVCNDKFQVNKNIGSVLRKLFNSKETYISQSQPKDVTNFMSKADSEDLPICNKDAMIMPKSNNSTLTSETMNTSEPAVNTTFMPEQENMSIAKMDSTIPEINDSAKNEINANITLKSKNHEETTFSVETSQESCKDIGKDSVPLSSFVQKRPSIHAYRNGTSELSKVEESAGIKSKDTNINNNAIGLEIKIDKVMDSNDNPAAIFGVSSSDLAQQKELNINESEFQNGNANRK